MRQQDLLELAAATDVVVFQRTLVQLADQLGFGLVSAALAVERPGKPTSIQMLGNTPQEFLEASRSVEDSRRDPVLRSLRTMKVPITYSRKTYAEADADDLWEGQAAYGYKTGIALALHLHAGRHFLLGVDRDEALPQDAALLRLMADLQLVAVYAQERAVALLDEPTPDIPALTRREREVLLWTAQGKTAEETGRILGITGRGVEFHAHNAARKLGAPNKHAAVARAVNLGLLNTI